MKSLDIGPLPPSKPGTPGHKPKPGALGRVPKPPEALVPKKRAASLLAEKRRKWGRLFLAAGLLLVLAGIPLAVLQIAAPPEAPLETPPETQAQQAETVLSPEQAAEVLAASQGMRNRFPRGNEAHWDVPPRADDELERKRVLKSLELDGRVPKFFPWMNLARPTPGNPVHCYCLLERPLDAYTEKEWNKTGLLRDENVVVSPYLRYVALDNEASFEALGHALISGVTYNLTPEPPEAPAAPEGP